MKKTGLKSSGAKSTAVCVVIGVLVAFVISLLFSAGLTSLVSRESLKEYAVGGALFAVRAVSTLIGVLVGTGLCKEKQLPTSAMVTAGYLLLLIGWGIALYDGAFQRIWMGVLSVLLGGAAGLLFRIKSKINPRKRRYSIK